MEPLLKMKFTSVNTKVLSLYIGFVRSILTKLDVAVKSVKLPTKTRRITVLKSPHVNKKAREQFEIKTYNCVLYIKKPLIKKYLLFLFLNKPKFIRLSIAKEMK